MRRVRRQRWFEIHDRPWFPGFLRDLTTEALEAVWNENHTYRPIAARLREAVARSGAEQIVDLCSGGGGPWPGLYDDAAAGLRVWLTDLYPNVRLLREWLPRGLTVRAEPVDASAVPEELRGFRTVFSSFHHFDPPAARAMLEDAFRRREGIGIFEGARRSPLTLALVTGVPLLALKSAAVTRPVRGQRIVWTWLIPVVPAVLWVDGVLSCLRSYSTDDLRELTEGLIAPDYRWEIGEARGGRVPIRYLIGTPTP
ncbi:MAG TPA: class I SAM-dependent methyltransferase [Acidobacteriaceae bacterium]|nr:class I SAM-dependent methyltransferase [Acidobacteriaceae bacterium]